jgi:hypothetical protein
LWRENILRFLCQFLARKGISALDNLPFWLGNFLEISKTQESDERKVFLRQWGYFKNFWLLTDFCMFGVEESLLHDIISQKDRR